ncbi:hypothetical protein PMZ80_010772 [Knufia obscura]|uniref:RRM domain-containing protein n=1 Tax=Knufia obscura TaxID=1635080 RepID=A0ABR0R9Q9_9EURO|nr:hypothetical protein PMZ80_010772 [Knufia obscura]
MADQEQYQDGQGEERPRRQFQQYPQRSNASNNWRVKDDTPRAEPQLRQNRQSGAFGSPRTFGGQGQQRETSDTRLYVGNLLYSAQKDDILQFFNENGFNVANISMSIDPETGRNPSYCFVDFENPEDASRAMDDLNGRDVLGRTVRISPGVARKSNFEGGEGPRQYGSPRGVGDRQQDGGKPPFERSGYSRDGQSRPSFQDRNSNQESSGPVKRLYMGNLPAIESADDVSQAIHTLIDPLGIEITNISNLRAPHESKAAEPGDHHYCFVDLAKPEDVDAVIEALDGKPAPWSQDGSSTLRVNKAREQANRRFGGEGRGGYGGGFQSRRTEGQRDWRTAGPRQEGQ